MNNTIKIEPRIKPCGTPTDVGLKLDKVTTNFDCPNTITEVVPRE